MIFVLIFSLTASQSFADVEIKSTTFPDSTFQAYVRENFDTDDDGTLTDDELAAVTEIDVSNKKINRLNGIEYFTALETLICDHNNLTNIDLSKNTALVVLDCSHNFLTRLDVSNSPNLNELITENNNIEVLNVSNTAVTSLSINDSFSRNYVHAFPEIKGIYAKNCTALEKIRVRNVFIRIDTLDLSGCTALTLFAFDSGYRDFDSYIKNLNLSGCTALEKLSGGNNSLSELQIESLDLSGCTALVSLDCSVNNLTKLDVSDCTALQYIDCSQNSLTMLDLSSNTALTSAKCINQKATEQKVTKSGNTYKFDFSKLIPSENISQIVSDSVHAYSSTGGTIETTYSDGVATFAYVPYEVEYGFATGYGDVNLSVNFKATTGGGGGTVTATAPKILTSYLKDGVTGISYVEELYATGTKPITWSITDGSLPDGLEITSDGVIHGTATGEGISEFTVQAENIAGTDTATFQIEIGASKILALPEITTTTLDEGTAEVSYGYLLKATGLRPVKWAITSGDFPNGLSLNEDNGQIAGIPTDSGDFTFTVQVQNAAGAVSRDLTLVINPAPEKTKPTIITKELEPGIVGQNYGFQLSATGTPPIRWSITNFKKIPKGVEFSSDGAFSGIIPKAKKVQLTVRADNEYGSVSKVFTLQSYIAPEIVTASLKDAKVGKSYNLSLKTKGSKTLKWTLDGALPQGFTWDNNKGRIKGTASINGTYKFIVALSNAVGDDVKEYTLNVVADAPKISAAKLSAGTVGKSYKANVKAKGTEPITYELEGFLPEGLSLDVKNATITGTPLEECTDRKIKIIASNMGGEDSKEFYLTVKGVAAAITLKALPAGAKGVEYSAPVTYAGTAPIELTAAGLPSGLEFLDGEITGTPTEGGTFNVVITAKNNTKTVTKKFKLQINEPPVFNDTSLADATADKSYTHKLSVTGTKKITFSISGGSLPSGLTLNSSNGAIKGKPTAAGDFTFTITASNAQGSSSKEFNLTVKGVAPKISGSLKKGKAGQSYTAALKVTGTAPITWVFDGDLPEGLDFSNGTLSGTPAEAFDGVINITAVNSGGRDTKSFRLVIAAVSTKKTKDAGNKVDTVGNSPIDKEAQKIFFGLPQAGGISAVNSIKISDDYQVAAVLPEIYVTESGLYDLEIEIEPEISTGAELKWLARPQNSEPSEDDEIAEFYDVDGAEISTVPDNHKIIISAWFNENIIYAPAVIVPRE